MKHALFKYTTLATVLFTSALSNAYTFEWDGNKENSRIEIPLSQEQSEWFKVHFPHSFSQNVPKNLGDLAPIRDYSFRRLAKWVERLIQSGQETVESLEDEQHYIYRGLLKVSTGIDSYSLSPFEQRRAIEKAKHLRSLSLEQAEKIAAIDKIEVKNLCLSQYDKTSSAGNYIRMKYNYTCLPSSDFDSDHNLLGFNTHSYDFKNQRYTIPFQAVPIFNVIVINDERKEISIPMTENVAETLYNQGKKVLPRISYTLEQGTSLWEKNGRTEVFGGIKFTRITNLKVEFINIDTQEVLYHSNKGELIVFK